MSTLSSVSIISDPTERRSYPVRSNLCSATVQPGTRWSQLIVCEQISSQCDILEIGSMNIFSIILGLAKCFHTLAMF